MNKRLLWGLLAATAVVPTAMWGADQTLTVSANIAKSCTLNAIPVLDAQSNILAGPSLGLTSSLLTIASPVTAGGIMQAWNFTLTMNSTCNHKSGIRLESQKGGLKDPSHLVTASGFINRFDYIATATWDGATGPSFLTAGSPIASEPPPTLTETPHTGTLTVNVFGQANTTFPVMAGSYSDTVTVSLIPRP